MLVSAPAGALEPGSQSTGNLSYYVVELSAALSLKRIADTLEALLAVKPENVMAEARRDLAKVRTKASK